MAVDRRKVAIAAVIAAALAIAVPVEYFQRFIGGRYPDVTDMVLSVAGAWLGSSAATGGWRRFREDVALYTAKCAGQGAIEPESNERRGSQSASIRRIGAASSRSSRA